MHMKDLALPRRPAAWSNVVQAIWPYRTWIWIGLVSAVLMYQPVVWCLSIWSAPDSPQAYQPLVPFAVAYLVWTRRKALADLAARTAGQVQSTIWLAVSGCVLMILAYPPEIPGLSVVAAILILAGAIYYLYGLPMLRALRGPLVFLLTAAPLQEAIIDKATARLQLASTTAAGEALRLMHLPIGTEGNYLVISDYRLEITPACSGLGLLLPVLVITIWLLMLMEATWLKRILLCCYSVATAVLINILRIIAMGAVAYYDHDVAAMLHDANSWLFTALAFAAMLGWARVLRINKVCTVQYSLRGYSLPPPP